MEIARISKGTYQAHLAGRSLYIVVATITPGKDPTKEVERLLRLLELQHPLHENWSLSIAAPTSGLTMKKEVRDAINEAADGAIVIVFCKNEGVLRATNRFLEASLSDG